MTIPEGDAAICTTICAQCAGEGRVSQDRASTICSQCHGTGRIGAPISEPRTAPTRCPACRSRQLDHQPMLDDTLTVVCGKCGSEWSGYDLPA